MQKEYIINTSTVLTVNLVKSAPESFRKVVEKTNTVRVYKDGCIGVAGSIGETDFDALEKQAADNLENKLPYPANLPKNKIKTVDNSKFIFDTDKMMGYVRQLMEKISKALPDFIFSNKIIYREIESHYKNTEGSDLKYKGNRFDASIIIKSKKSANLFDLGYGFHQNYADTDAVVKEIVELCEKYDTPVDIEPGKYPVLAESMDFLMRTLKDMTVEAYAANSSLYKGKLNEKIFADSYSLYIDRNPEENYCLPFFDAEGEYTDDYRQYVIKDGVLVNLLGNKRSADLYKLPVVKSSSAQYDSIPAVGFFGFTEKYGDKSFAQLTKEKTVMVIMASGGDITTSGDYATPVQYAYLVQDGKMLGRLPDIKIHNNIFNIYGSDYVCAFEMPGYSKTRFTLTHMNVEK